LSALKSIFFSPVQEIGQARAADLKFESHDQAASHTGRQPPRTRQQKERKRRRRIVVGRRPIVSHRRGTISDDVDLVLLQVLSRGGIGWIRESDGDESGGNQRSDGKSGHDWFP
jgi:hypothetical protein